MKLGVIQGRLSEPVDGHIQQFPENWEREFDLINDIGLDHMEWLVTTKSFSKILSLNPKKYSDKITSIGCDNLIYKNIKSKDFLDEQLEPVCEFAIKNNIKSITIPLLEDSKIDDFVDIFIKNILTFSNKYQSLRFNFELESPWEIAAELCGANNNFFLTYDTGNITACKYDHKEYLEKCSEYIDIVHLKDKTIKFPTNVEPGTGDVNFDLIFNVLVRIGYNQRQNLFCRDLFTLQTSRGDIGMEINTVKKHKKFFEDLYIKYYTE